MATETYVKDDQTRLVRTPSQRVQAKFDGFKPAETDAEKAAEPNDQAPSITTDDDSSDAPARPTPYDF